MLRVGRWMSRAEYDVMAATGRLQPTLDGREMKHVTAPPDADSFRAASPGSIFAEFDVDDAQMVTGGREGLHILYGPNCIHGRKALQKGVVVTQMPVVQNCIITRTI